MKTCEYCGCQFESLNRNRRFHSDDCRLKALAERRKKIKYPRPFVGLDGEGETRNGYHRYILLASGNGFSIADRNGLSTIKCLDFLLQLPRGIKYGERPIYVWFAFDYDVNMILGDVPLKGENSIENLRRDRELEWSGYFIRYFPRKYLQITKGKTSHTSYDTWSFYGTTFENALGQFGISTNATITEGKRSRKNFTTWGLKSIAEYNDAELVALSELSEKLRNAIAPLEIPISSWHGPGSIANGWLRKNKATDYIREFDYIQEGVNCAYFGGRIDAIGYGFFDPIYHYDIVSAYPSSARWLPDLSSLTFEKGNPKLEDFNSLYLAKISWNVTDETAAWAPFPWRNSNGTIRNPLAGQGWYWSPEIESAKRDYKWPLEIRIEEIWYAVGKIRYPFRNLIEEAFEYRKELKKQGDQSHIAIKLLLNSIYGKFAQTVGKPKYHCLPWAGLITANTRGQLLKAIDENTVCVMTDSIWARKPLAIELGNGLGEWERGEETEMVLAMAGIYEAKTPSGHKEIWQRGFNKERPVNIPRLVRRWIRGTDSIESYKVQRFIGMGLASQTSYPWRNWVELTRTINPVPDVGTTKRYGHYPHDCETDCTKSEFIELELRIADENCCSYPYKKETVDIELIQFDLEEECEE